VRIQNTLVAVQIVTAAVSLAYLALASGETVNKDSKTIAAFEKRVAESASWPNAFARFDRTPGAELSSVHPHEPSSAG
jgi:hypothetical protein